MAVEEEMSFKISQVQGQPQSDSLPVAKITHYPLEERDYKPFAQASLCLSRDGLLLRLWAFEVTPEPSSSLRAVFALCPGASRRTLSVEIFPDHTTRFLVDGSEADATGLHTHHFTGEDLQGLYWGATILLPHSLLQAHYPGLVLGDGAEILGNLFKLCDGERPHRGSFLPVDFTGCDPFAFENLGDFQVVSF